MVYEWEEKMLARGSYSGSNHRAFEHPLEVGFDDFLDLGIDDLAKYRIVQLFCARPGICWDAGSIAERLGLRPLERTVEELEELADRHLVEPQDMDSNVKYKLTTDRRIQFDLSILFAVARTPRYSGNILRRLASRSLERIRAKGKTKRANIYLVPQSLDTVTGNCDDE
jgi:hypothetical protein